MLCENGEGVVNGMNARASQNAQGFRAFTPREEEQGVIRLKRKLIAVWIVAMLCAAGFHALGEPSDVAESPLPVKVLLLPKFEVGEMAGDFPGEAQYYFEQYLTGAEAYDVPNGDDGFKLYYKDGVALGLLGMGKVNAALNTMAILSDSRFDYSQAYIIDTGCAGSAVGTTVMGDVFLITAAVDYDLGHHADGRELADPDGTTWFRDEKFDDSAVVLSNQALVERVYALVKDAPIETTERTRNYMINSFDGAEWAARDPQVLRGTTVSGDNYWKGPHGHENALLMAETYQCPDPYVTTEMENVAVARAVERMGLLDRLIIIRDSVNMDVFMQGDTPESLWENAEAKTLATDEGVESADIFQTAMKNNFDVGRIIIDRILDGRF